MPVCWCLCSWRPLCGASSRGRRRCSLTRCTGWSDGSIWSIFPEDAATGTGDHDHTQKLYFCLVVQPQWFVSIQENAGQLVPLLDHYRHNNCVSVDLFSTSDPTVFSPVFIQYYKCPCVPTPFVLNRIKI